jgi:hypothetical protein
MNEIQLENLMRGFAARMGQLLEVILVNVVFNTLAVGMGLFSVYLVTVVRTPQAFTFAPYVVAGSLAMTAKGGFLLHRKWREYDKAETTDQQKAGAWRNPSIDVTKDSRSSVLLANILAVAAIALPVLLYSYYEIFLACTFIGAVVRILPSLAIVAISLWAWLQGN